MKRGHEFVVVNSDLEGKLYSRVDTTGMTFLAYQSPKSEAEWTAWVSKQGDGGGGGGGGVPCTNLSRKELATIGVRTCNAHPWCVPAP